MPRVERDIPRDNIMNSLSQGASRLTSLGIIVLYLLDFQHSKLYPFQPWVYSQSIFLIVFVYRLPYYT